MSMGWSETEQNELAVMPWILPGSCSTVTTVTPVANRPIALRNSDNESEEVGIWEVFEDTILGAGKAKQCVRMGNSVAASRMNGGTRNGVNRDGANDCDFGRDGTGRHRAGVPAGEGRGMHFDRFAGCGAGAGNGEAVARTGPRRTNRGERQSFGGSGLRYRHLDGSLLGSGGAAETIEECMETGNDCD